MEQQAVEKPDSAERRSTLVSTMFLHLEHISYTLLGLLLAGAAALALVNVAVLLFHGVLDFGGNTQIVDIIDKLLFVFMLIEILHTVRASLRTGGLSCEPFLVVGLIASIRRVLVITLETSQVSRDQQWTPQAQVMVRYSMIELGVMTALILAMVFSIYLLHRATPGTEEPAGSSL